MGNVLITFIVAFWNPLLSLDSCLFELAILKSSISMKVGVIQLGNGEIETSFSKQLV